MVGASMLASTAIGAAKGALAAYLEMTTGRKTRGALAGGAAGTAAGASFAVTRSPSSSIW